MRIIKCGVLIFVLLFIYCGSNAQKSSISISDFDYPGFPYHQSIVCVFEDSEGLLWIGTNSGLYQYDGNKVRHFQYDVFDPTSIPNNSVKHIYEDREKNLWIGTESYLVRYSRRKDAFYSYFKGQVFSFLEISSYGNIQAVSQRSVLLDIKSESLLDHIEVDTLFNAKKLSGEKLLINEVKTDEFDRIWVATNRGLFFLDQSKLKSVGLDFSVDHILMSSDQLMWLCSEDQLYKVSYTNSSHEINVLKKFDLSENDQDGLSQISAILERKDNSIWVSSNKGLFRSVITNGQFRFEKLDLNIGSTPINCFVEDQNGNLWIGTQKGLKKYVRNASVFNMVALEHFDPSLHDANVSSLYYDDQDNLWIALYLDKISKFNTISKKSLATYPVDDIVYKIKPSLQKGKYWTISDMAIGQIDNTSNDQPEITTFSPLGHRVDDFLEINSDEFWIGFWGVGIQIKDDLKAISEFKKEVVEKTKGAYISFTYRDKKGIIWVGTRGKGLYQVNVEKKEITQFLPDLEIGITSNAFLSYCEDFYGDMWFGTRGGGLIYYEREKNVFTSYTVKEGMPSNTVSSLEQDHRNNIWMSTQNGIARLSFDDKSIASFGNINGLEVTQFNFNSSTKSIDSEKIYFGFRGGFYEIICDNYVENTLVPITRISSLKIYGNESQRNQKEFDFASDSEQEEISLPYNQNDISIEFSSSDLSAPAKNLYAYQLEGVNNYWIFPTDNTHKADYFDLSPGEYTFKVKSTNSDGLWNDVPTTLKIKITPPFWLSWWACVFYVLCGIGLLYGFYIAYRRWYTLKKNLLKTRVSREKDNQFHNMRMVFFTDIAHELRTPLTLILSSMEHFISKNKGDGNHKNRSRIFNNANKMKHLINQIMDIRKHSEGEFKLQVKKCNAVQVIKTIQANFSDLARINKVALTFHADKEEIVSFIDLAILEKIVNNILSNALKHTPANGKIEIHLSEVKIDLENLPSPELKEGRYLRCIVRDSGVGMNEVDLQHIFNRYYQAKDEPVAQMKGTGIGMELVSKLVRLHLGHIKADSRVNEFTEFTIWLPADRDLYPLHQVSKEEEIEDYEIEMLKSATSIALPVVEPESVLKKVNQQGKILIVDDNEEFQNMIKEQLEMDHLIITAINGLDAMKVASEQRPDLIICDIYMPEEDGISFLKKIKKNDDLSHIPVIMLSANIDEKTKKESIQCGAEDFIEKPFSLEFLKWKISNTLSYQKSMMEIYSKKITAEPSKVEIESPDERLLKDVIEIIEKNIANTNLSVEFLSSEVGMSRANLYRKIQKLMNDTPVNLIKKMRLKRAKQIIELNKFYIVEVAEMTGFKSQRYFSTCFQKEYNITPMAYNKQFVQENEVVGAEHEVIE
ncbi:hybrid sensor histidine kinase/response regulator transcription factor [Portibacter lacus]|uniref:histidine kinase n=1 Tax=Portibacter lacus TaxID=1099794 RepID=A0AA37SS36_9BACT|nr:two-component regulator propeller domain-containing protein [Portibacter lacus]GLR17165.1 hybrid sensor histidine kinase/response regulator [Portibacter lacus]